jgi:hypothetical protein
MNTMDKTIIKVNVEDGVLIGYMAGRIYNILRQLNRQQLEALKERINLEIIYRDSLDLTA